MHPMEVYYLDGDHLAHDLEKPVRLKPGTVGMSKEECGQRRARKGLREMLSAVEERVDKLEGSMEDVNEALDGFEGHIDNWKEQTRDYVKMSLNSTMDKGKTSLDLPSPRKGAYVKGITRKIRMSMTMATATIVVMGNYELGRRNPREKRDKLKCFLCDGPHMLKKCLMKTALRKKPVGKALGLGSSVRGVEAKEAESEKKPVKCFLCHGPHRLRKCLRKSVIDGNNRADTEPRKLGSSKGKAKAKRAKRSKSVIEGNDGVDKEPKKLGSSKGKAEVKRAKRSKKKRVKCFLCRGLHELRNCLKQAVVKGMATPEHVKLGPMRLESSEASELAELSTRLPPMGEVGGASDFKEKEVMHVGQGSFEVLEQGGRKTVGKAKPSVVNHEDSIRGKLECGQGSDITPCRRDVQMSRTARVKKRWKPRKKSRRKGRAKATSGI
ncbi:hypothetical protein PVK06_030511 [Gossypium arboreum]|uniref:Uncharacterized protein n=1 Tax=Gossypium arboreum TaxID=29729 RepID=A0ABR0NRP5_GOSAR|nr:hypothetical protein PVK06_030511 [Gossypium arboreum]